MPDPETEAQLRALTDVYLERLQAGDEPDVYEILAAHPHLAAELEERLDAVNRLHQLAVTPFAVEKSPIPDNDRACCVPLPERIGRYRILGRAVARGECHAGTCSLHFPTR